MAIIIENKKINSYKLSLILSLINVFAVIIFILLKLNTIIIKDVFIISVSAQSALMISIFRLGYVFRKNVESNLKDEGREVISFRKFIELNLQLKKLGMFILSSLFLILGQLANFGLMIVLVLAVIQLFLNLIFCFYLHKLFSVSRSGDIIVIVNTLLIASQVFYFHFGKFLLLLNPLWGLVYRWIIK